MKVFRLLELFFTREYTLHTLGDGELKYFTFGIRLARSGVDLSV